MRKQSAMTSTLDHVGSSQAAWRAVYLEIHPADLSGWKGRRRC